ncbi:putative endopeptidase, NLPC/P60 domain, LRAT-like domain protein [Tanacetum coccineum]
MSSLQSGQRIESRLIPRLSRTLIILDKLLEVFRYFKGTYGENSKSARKESLNVVHGSSSNTPIIDKTDKLECQILDGKLMFVDDDGNPLIATGNVDSESDVEVVFDETTNLMASMRFKGGSDKASIEFLYAKARGGTCSMAKSDPLEDVMHRATYLYENGYGKYDLTNNNCEDFALYCKTCLWSTDKESQGRSSQANTVRPTRHAKKDKDMIESVTRIATSIPRSFSKRENKDLGHRNDVVKVPVEELSSFCRSLNQ